MLSVAIMINGNPIMARSAVNTGKCRMDDGSTIYDVDDDGSRIYHNPDDAPVALAKKLLDTIQEQGR